MRYPFRVFILFWVEHPLRLMWVGFDETDLEHPLLGNSSV